MHITYFYRNHRAGYSIKKVSDLFVAQMEDKSVFEMPSQYASLKSILQNMYYTFVHRSRKGINHITGDIHYCILPLIGCKTVLTVHDTCVYDTARGFKRLLFKLLWYKLPLRFATKIVCISEATRQSLKRFTKRDDIIVIPNAVDPAYKSTVKEFNAECPNILLIGTNWNKNIERTVRALADINCKLTIIGRLTPSQKEALAQCNTKYTEKNDLTDDEIRQEYEQCDMVCFCSIYEGFGMPIIEANAIGRPVITSNLSPMKEVAGGSAVLVNPQEEAEIRQAVLSVITNKALREQCIKHGSVNVKKYQQDYVVNRYKNLYKELS